MTISVFASGMHIDDNGNLVLDADEMDAAGVGVVEFIEGTPEAQIAELEARLKDAEEDKLRITKLEAELREAAELLEKRIGYGVGLQCVAEGVRVVIRDLTAAEARAEAAEERIKTLEAANASWKRYHDAGSAAYERAEKAEADAGRLKEANTRMHEDIEALENVADLRRIALEQVEYHQAYTLSCPWCFSLQESGHKPDCARQAALSPAATAEQPAPRDVSGESEK